jgi:hypothetical protein
LEIGKVGRGGIRAVTGGGGTIGNRCGGIAGSGGLKTDGGTIFGGGGGGDGL